MFIIAGLGNPTKEYEGTRHNVGFQVIDKIAEKYNIAVDAKKGRAYVGKGIIEGQKVLLVKPQTYMNLSGESIRELVDYFKVDSKEELLVIYDDISLDVGRLRDTKKGQAPEGIMESKILIAHLGTQEFPRIKVGIGNKPEGWDLADYVLSKYSKAEQEALKEASDDVIGAVRLMIMDDIDAAMNRYNAKKRDT